MLAVGEKEIRASFVNCSKGEAGRLNLPRDLAERPWADLDFLGWRDPGAPDRGYLVMPYEDRLAGITLRAPQGPRKSLTKTNICSLCLTSHAGSGVTLLAARRAGAAGRQGNTVGAYICADLSCSLYVRGKKKLELAQRFEETLTLDEQIERLVTNAEAFLAQVFRQA
ncbi:FBP domain-containing protein [Streptomyces sp. NPDC057702]|uniref:FBP domain-containing protein n=1 Tax=unclassified Streptomyces TaxID=2593676 RepID=UPI00369A2B54